MEPLDRNIISILESHTRSLIKNDEVGVTFDSNTWSNILLELGLFVFPPSLSISKDLTKEELYETPYIEINDNYKGTLIKNFYSLSFDSLYPQIIYNIITGVSRKNEESPIKVFAYLFSRRKYFKAHLSLDGYNVLKIWINFFYGKLLTLDVDIRRTDVTSEARSILKIAQKLSLEWYYADREILFFKSKDLPDYKNKLDKIGYSYLIEPVKNGIFFAKKKYIIGDEHTKIIGFQKTKK